MLLILQGYDDIKFKREKQETCTEFIIHYKNRNTARN